MQPQNAGHPAVRHHGDLVEAREVKRAGFTREREERRIGCQISIGSGIGHGLGRRYPGDGRFDIRKDHVGVITGVCLCFSNATLPRYTLITCGRPGAWGP